MDPTESLSPKAPACTLIMVRHGESLANLERRFTRDDDEPLTELGIRQAEQTGRQLHAAGFSPARLYASPFLRARETARLIGGFFGLEPNEVPQLREQSFGEFKGQPYERYFPLIADIPPNERWFTSAPGGESLHQVALRVGPTLDRIAVSHPAEEVLVVSHGGVMAALRGYCRGNFLVPPESTENAGGYLLHYVEGVGYQGPVSISSVSLLSSSAVATADGAEPDRRRPGSGGGATGVLSRWLPSA